MLGKKAPGSWEEEEEEEEEGMKAVGAGYH